MTVHNLHVDRAALTPRPPRYPAAHLLGDLDARRMAKRLVVFTPSGSALDALVARARSDIANLAPIEVVRRVISHNPDAFWAIARRDRYDVTDPVGEGFVAFLMLNHAGLQRLVAGSFDAGNPDLALLAAQSEEPAAIYVWALHARGSLAAGVSLVFDKISTPLYQDVDLFARAATPDGHRFLETLGFRRGAEVGGVIAPQLFVYRRSTTAAAGELPLYDSYRASTKGRALAVTLARNFDDLTRVASVRSAVYLAEQDCPYEEEFDGNDLSATHLLGYIGDEPAGCLRIRYFADFAKLERLAVRHEYRQTRLAFRLVRAGIELCRMKGYRRLYGHAQKRLVNFWGHFGFRTFAGGRELVFSDFEYVEMVLDAPRHPQAISIGVDPYVIIRPEGRWHLPGVLERSSGRAPSRPNGGHQTQGAQG